MIREVKKVRQLEIDDVLSNLKEDEQLRTTKFLKCIKTFTRDGKDIFTEGKEYKVLKQYGKSFLIRTNEGYGHAVTEGNTFKEDHFKRLGQEKVKKGLWK